MSLITRPRNHFLSTSCRYMWFIPTISFPLDIPVPTLDRVFPSTADWQECSYIGSSESSTMYLYCKKIQVCLHTFTSYLSYCITYASRTGCYPQKASSVSTSSLYLMVWRGVCTIVPALCKNAAFLRHWERCEQQETITGSLLRLPCNGVRKSVLECWLLEMEELLLHSIGW